MRIMVFRYLLLYVLVFISLTGVKAQLDSVSLQLDEMGLDDVRKKSGTSEDQQMITGGRFLQDKNDIPFTSFIITKEEILDNGYITLVDVMKSLPGIRVSQPGSGQDGETFMLRGLLGNSHMKILLNDNPIKPSIVKGMPIGAQLPIRQAERIEIIYGPAAVLYGADASIGVINIITKESERPVYAQADLSVGANGFSSIDVMFGGKLGQNKHIIRYNVYGSNTVMNNRYIFYDDDFNYNPLNYIPNMSTDSSFVNSSNYSGTAARPDIAATPHLSRLFGVHLNYKDFSLSGKIMYRRDHSSIGLSPLAVSYANSGTYWGENIIHINMGLSKNYKNWGFRSRLNYLRYEVDVNSSHLFVQEKLSRAILRLTENVPSTVTRDSLRALANSNYFRWNRYGYALSNDTRIEQLFYANPTDYLNITTGGNLNLSVGLTPSYFLDDQYDNTGIVINNQDPVGQLEPSIFSTADWNIFIQTQLNLKKLKAIFGYQYYGNFDGGVAHTPQIALLYKLNDSFNLRASYNSAFRVPSAFYSANTYSIDLNNLGNIDNQNQELNPETIQGFEIGIRSKVHTVFKSDISIFYTRVDNLISFNFDDANSFEVGLDDYTLGYFNDFNSQAIIYGVQAQFETNWNTDNLKIKSELNLNYNRGREILPSGKGILDLVRGQPAFIGQLNLSFRFWDESIYLRFSNNYVSKFATTDIVNVAAYYNNPEEFTNDGFYTLDIISRYRISKNFQGYMSFKNVFNKQYAGIDASGTIDDLIYNPQSLRTFTLGLSYRIE